MERIINRIKRLSAESRAMTITAGAEEMGGPGETFRGLEPIGGSGDPFHIALWKERRPAAGYWSIFDALKQSTL